MPFAITQHTGYHVLNIRDKFLGSIEGRRMIDAIMSACTDSRAHIIIDLSKTTYIDSTGLGVLTSIHHRIDESGGRVIIAGMDKRIRNVFLMTNLLDRVFENFDTVQEAVQSIT
jgi:anti-anti-sigma factor